MVATLAGQNNVFLRDHASTGALTIDFSRNVRDFALNRYVKLIPVQKTGGYWLEMTVEEAGRVLSANDEEHSWPDGQPSPSSNDGTESFEWKDFRTERKAFLARLGDLTIEQASWPIVNQHSRIKAQQAMTSRARHVLGLLTNTGSYLSGHTSAVASISGNTGTWAASTSARQDIHRSINFASKEISKKTMGRVKKSDLVLVVSPDCATEIAECQEIVEMLKGSQHSKGYIQGDLWDNSEWGLPSQLYGVNLVVEDTVATTTRKGIATTKGYVLGGSSAILLARPGALEGVAGTPEFSSVSLFVYSQGGEIDLDAEVMHDVNNRLTDIRVTDNRVAKITSPLSSFLFTDVI